LSPDHESDGGDWLSMDSGTNDSLEGIWGNSGDSVFAVSYEGTILHYDGDVWSEVYSNSRWRLFDVWGTSGSDVFAVGLDRESSSDADIGVILHYDGDTWTRMDSRVNCPLYGVSGTGATDVFAVGGRWLDPKGPHGVALHYDGSRWRQTATADDLLSSIWSSDHNEAYAVGGDAWGVGMVTTLFGHYDGDAWHQIQAGWGAPLRDVWGTDPSNVYAVGESATIFHYDGTTCNETDTGGAKHLSGVWGSGRDVVLAVGGEWDQNDVPVGTILRLQNGAWRTVKSGLDHWLNAVWGSDPDSVFAVGGGGTILHYSAGFTPVPDGYSFCNGPTSRPCDPGWGDSRDNGDFTEDDMITMFGKDTVCNMRNGTCHLKLTAAAWLNFQNSFLNGGHCFGMASTSLRFYQGMGDSEKDEPSDFQADAPSTYALDLDNVRRHISYHQVMQSTSPLKQYVQSQRAYNEPSRVLDQLRSAMPSSSEDPMMLVMYKWEGFPFENPKAHAVTPYALQEKEGGIWWVYVYDSNHPGIETLYIAIDTAANTWDYVGLDWAGGAFFPETLVVVPMSKFDQPPSCPWCAAGRLDTENEAGMAEVWLEGRSHVLITDDQGRRIGYTNGQYVNEIPGAYETVLAAGLESDPEPVYTIPLRDAYSVSLDSRGLTRTKEVAAAQFGPDYAILVADIVMEPDSQDQMMILPDGTLLAYESQHSKEIDLTLTREDTGESRRFSLKNADVGTDQTVTMTLDTNWQTLAFSNKEADGGEYTLDFRREGTMDWHWFVHSDIPISATDTHHLDYGAWDGSGPMILHIDRGSDGIIEDTLQLENHVEIVHLPLIAR
jgi:hypothetical protein